MSLAAPYQEHYYVADGSTTSFAFGQSFTALNEIDVKCIIYFEDGTNCVPVFNVNMTTGFINIVSLTKPDGTLLTVPPAGSIVRVFRKTPEAQNVTASQLQNYTAKQLERVFDSLVAMIQEISYSDIHKTVRLTETQRDIAIDYLPDDKDQAVIYWDVEERKLMPAGFGQNQVVKSDGVEWLVYNQSEGKVYFIPRQGGNPIPIGKATIHNDLSGRNAPDCHPESAITGLREHLQELRDKDSEIEEDVQTALNRSQEAKDTADEAKGTAEYAQTVAGEAKGIAENAKETAEGIEDIAQEAKDTADEAKEIAQDAKDIAEGAVEDIEAVEEGLENHIANKSNPHEVTKAQVGLGNVDNTSDLNKPISTATQTALDLKMPISTKYGAALSLTINSTTYVVTAQLKDQDGNNLGTAQTIDLPLESVVVSGAYDSATKEVVLILQDGSKIRFSVADLVSGLQSEITAQNPLDADLVNDSASTHKFVTATEKTNWNNHIGNTNNPHSVTKAQVGLGNVDNTSDLNKPISTATQTALNGKQATISDLATIRSNAQAGKAASDTIATYGDIVTHNVSEFATATQGAKADTALQPGDNVSELVNDAGYLTQHQTLVDLGITATAGEINVLDGITATTTELNYTDGVTSNIQTQLNGKQATISDLATIRSGAAAGATAVQPGDLATVATSGSYNDLSDKPTIPADISAHRVNGAPLSNSASVYFGTSSTAAATAEKVVSIPSIQTLDAGVAIVVLPTVTSTVANSTIKLNNFPAYPMRYGNAAITTSTDTYVWTANTPSIFVFDGSYWRFVAQGYRQVYSTMSVAEGKAGTATTGRVLRADYLKQIIQGTTLTGIDVATTGAVSATDTITDGIGKLQATKADKSELPTVGNGTITITQGGITKGTFTTNQSGDTTVALDAGGGGIGNIDNLTITANTDDEIQTVATINANTATGATNPIYDWVGTLAEYKAQSIESLHPAWVCFITDDLSAEAYEAYTKGETLNMFVQKGHQVIEFQKPTAANNYTWYRKYADGWVEQGGNVNGGTSMTATFPIEMADTHYTVAYGNISGTYEQVRTNTKTTTSINIKNSSGGGTVSTDWQVSGMAA